MAQRHVVILGGSGFVGRHLVARLLQAGDRITVLSRGVDPGKRALRPPGASLIEGDVGDRGFLSAVLDDADA
ncbi:MAG TPA: NAD-dependent epimerase/dehydratase family protein, partial [Burkholderiaceae bacterium]